MLKNKHKGFTLVELIIVIVIIGILAAVAIPFSTSIVKKAKLSSDKSLLRNLNKVISLDRIDGSFKEDASYMRDLFDEEGLSIKLQSKEYALWYDLDEHEMCLGTLDDAIGGKTVLAASGDKLDFTKSKPENCIDGLILVSPDGFAFAEACNLIANLSSSTMSTDLAKVVSLIDEIDNKDIKAYLKHYLANTVFYAGGSYICYKEVDGSLVKDLDMSGKYNVIFTNDSSSFVVTEQTKALFENIKIVEIQNEVTTIDEDTIKNLNEVGVDYIKCDNQVLSLQIQSIISSNSLRIKINSLLKVENTLPER